MRVLSELQPIEKQRLLTMIGRGIDETCKGLDVAPIRWAVMIEYDEHSMVGSNLKENSSLLEWLAGLQQSIMFGDASMKPVSIPKRIPPREGFLEVMRRSRGTHPVSDDELHCMVMSYVSGYLEATVQFAGVRAAKQIAMDLKYTAEPGWMPGDEWRYWLHEPRIYAVSSGGA